MRLAFLWARNPRPQCAAVDDSRSIQIGPRTAPRPLRPKMPRRARERTRRTTARPRRPGPAPKSPPNEPAAPAVFPSVFQRRALRGGERRRCIDAPGAQAAAWCRRRRQRPGRRSGTRPDGRSWAAASAGRGRSSDPRAGEARYGRPPAAPRANLVPCMRTAALRQAAGTAARQEWATSTFLRNDVMPLCTSVS